jgi:DNA (cytosine-5)-methyltransferase 1
MQSVKVLSITEHRGSPRFWTEGSTPEKAGFAPGARFSLQSQSNGVLLQLDPEGDRTVSRKLRGGKEIPILDINSKRDLQVLQGHDVVRVVFGEGQVFLSPLASETRRIRRLTRLKTHMAEGGHLTVAGICAGGGVLSHAIHAGLGAAGLVPKMVAHNEIREDLCDHALAHNEALDADTVILNLPLQELAFDQSVLKRIGEVDIAELGLPCSGASVAGRAKLKLSMPEAHPDVGHLVVGGLALLAQLNPSVAIFENVPQYANTASALLIRQQLRDMGYDTHERELFGPDFGTLEARTRWCLVAVTRGIDFDFSTLTPEPFSVRTLSEVLDPLDSVADRWSNMTGLKAKEVRDKEAGKGFRMQIYDGSETRINTLTKGISKNRSTDPKIRHPENPDLLRIPTAQEHARCKGVPEALIEGLAQTTAHELLGQGICHPPFKAVAKHLGAALTDWAMETGEIIARPIAMGLAA